MKNTEADSTLRSLGQSRKWLAEQTGYSVATIYSLINGEEKELSSRMSDAFQRAFDEERTRRESPFKDQSKLWDSVFFSASETMRMDAARAVSAHETLEEFFHDGVCWYADDLLKKEGLAAHDP